MATQTTNIPGSGYGNVYLDSLIWGVGWTDTATPIRYWFGSGLNVLPSGFPTFTSFFIGDAWTVPEKSAFEAVMAQYSAVCNLTFIEAQSGSVTDADIVWWKAPGSVMVYPKGKPVDGAHEVPNAVGQQINGYFNYETPTWQYLEKGQYGYVTVLHELGHAMGLAHPHDGGVEADATTFPGVTGPSSTGTNGLNQGIWTTMSYNRGWDQEQPHQTYGQQGTLMAFDIAALQALYGANMSTATGADFYQLPAALGPGTYWECIWDAGGYDGISNAGSASACIINLNAAPLTGANAAGYVSYIPGIPGGFTIANGVVIENAIGGWGDDNLVGNAAGNTLDGGGGADTMSGGAGNDLYWVDNVKDKVVESSGSGYDSVVSTISLTLAANVESLYLPWGNLSGTGNALDNNLCGGSGNNTLSGKDGNDWLWGGAGADTLTGGKGADTFFWSIGKSAVGAGLRDVITDFNAAQGDKIDVTFLFGGPIVGAFTYIGAAAFSAAWQQLRFENGILSGETTGDGVADFEIQLSGVRSFDAASLIL